MRLRVCSLLLLFMALSSEATDTLPEHNDEPASKTNGSEYMKKKNSKNIFIYNPHLGYHHVHFMTTIANALDNAGHNVTILDSLINDDIKPLPYRSKTIRTRTVGQDPLTKDFAVKGETSPDGLMAVWTHLPFVKKVRSFFSFYKSVTGFSGMVASQCKGLLKSDEFKEINDLHYDLAITEVFDFCGVGLTNVIKVKKTILASSVPLHEYIGEKLGLPKTFDIVPTKFSMSTAYEHRKDFREYETAGFISNVMESSLIGQNMFGYLEMKEAAFFQEKYPNFPGFDKLLRKSHSLIENVHTLMDLSKPTLNSIIPIGGITHYDDTKTEPSDEKAAETEAIKRIISKAKKNNLKVVLVSFGTVMKTPTMKNEIIENMLEAFKDTTAQFIWKAKKDELKKKGIELPSNSNVHVSDWLPQNELLASGDIDLFVSHMGIGSMTEAAYHGIPMIAIPIFVDQHYNYVCAKRLKIARFVDKYSLESTSRDLRSVIQDELDKETMKGHSKQLAENLKKFGNQTTRMMDHINFILSLPDDSESIAFLNHHHGLNLMLSIRSLLHLVPYYAVPITTVVVVIISIIFGYLLRWCCNRWKNLEYPLSKNVEQTKANGNDSKRLKERKKEKKAKTELPNENGTAGGHAQPIHTPKTEISFGIVTLVSVVFYCILFMLLALFSSKFCPVANKMSEMAKHIDISKISEMLHMSTNTILAFFIVLVSIAILFVLAYISSKLCDRYTYFCAISQFTIHNFWSFIVFALVLWGCKEYASAAYYEVRK